MDLVTNEIRKLSEETNAAVDETHNVTEESIKMIDIQENKNKEVLNFYSKLSDMVDQIQRYSVKLKKDNEITFGINPFTSPVYRIYRIY